MNWFEKTLMKISLILRKLSVKLKDFAMGLYTQRMIDQQLPPVDNGDRLDAINYLISVDYGDNDYKKRNIYNNF